uniref:Liprin-beta n=1 Tax=Panagrellus redivivus TaxID=6233 RepID=A0A7E4V618_PANRE
MTNELDDYDDFREANLLLTTTLKQLDDVISKGAATGSLYRLYSDSRTSVHSAMNGNDYDNRSSSTPHRSTSISSTSGNGIRISGHSVDTHNNSSDINGNGSSDFADGSQMIPMSNGHSTVSHLSNVPQTKAPIQWNMSVSNWIDHASKVTPESSGSVSPDSFGVDESPPSDALNSSSGNGLDDPMPEPICQPPPSPVGRLLEAIDGNRLNSPLDSSSKIKILQWINKLQDPQNLSPSPSMSTVSCPEYPELQDKLHKLAMARDSLSLQVTVLNEQVGTQREKIRDLESLLATKRKTFAYDSVCENTTEAQKTDLINEINMLKNKYALLEKDKVAAERRLQMSQAEIDRLSQTMHQIVTQHGIQLHHPHGGSSAAAAANDHNIEMEQLRITVQRLIADNEQKSIEINSLRNALDEHSRAIENYGLGSQRSSFGQVPPPAPQPQSFNINAQLRKLLVDDSKENIAHSNSFPVSLCSSGQQSSAYGSMSSRTPVPSTSYTSSLSMASPQPSSWSSGISAAPRNIHHTNSLIGPSASFGPNMSASSNFRSPSSPAARQLAAELDELRRINGELSLQQQSNQPYSTNSLPRHLPINGKNGTTLTLPLPKLSIGSSGANGSVNGASRRKRGPPTSASTRPNAWKLGHVYDEPGNNESRSRAVTKRSTSAPNLGPRGIHALMSEDYLTSRCSDVEIESDDEILRNGQPSATQSTSNFKRGRTRSTLRNFLGKLTRSTSQEIPTGAFRRGSGVRASASARLATIGAPVAGAIAIRPPVQQFVDWNTEQICEWFAEIGFTQYVPDAERYVRSGRHLLNMTDNELEKELVIKNPLHRKRLKCILDCIDKNATGPADRMDVHQVLLWLDMIGVPQFREAFSENLIDGQMLLCLTAQDLIDMKITSALNHATLARGIQFLHSVDFHLHRLEKVFNNEVMLKLPIANEVEKWAHACVSHWLKSIDLAEFTPNLIFSGIHGALMVHEPTFTAESLAEVLQIPAHKTLLRRHLTTQFNNLLGQEVISRKRETLAQPFVTFLSPTLRVKLVKKGFSLSRKKNKNEVYVEPHVPVYSPRARQYYGTSTLTATDI